MKTTRMASTTSSGIWWVNTHQKKNKKTLDKQPLLCYNKGTKKEEEYKMFDWNQIADAEYEKALEQYWDCPEAMLDDEWPDDLWDE